MDGKGNINAVPLFVSLLIALAGAGAAALTLLSVHAAKSRSSAPEWHFN